VNTTKVLAIVGAATGTIATLWAPFLSVVYDRARVTVTVVKVELHGPFGTHRPVLTVKVRNRGRRVTHIETVSRVASA
jgi:hypothetical protein